MANVHSFDVFDTLLIRKVASPPDVFRLLGSLIARKASIADEDIFVEDFLSSRIRAEKTARTLCAETTLENIWEILREMVPQLPPSCSFQDELDIERDQLLPNSAVAQQVARLRSAGARMIFASDTYFPETFVREQLSRYGLIEAGDGLYVSNSTGVAKWTGALFKVILEREAIAPGDLLHYGDDAETDVAVPRRLGIKATLITDARLNTWEDAVLWKRAGRRMPKSLLAGSMRAFRLSTVAEFTDGSNELVATLLGPALMIWAAWVLSTARRDGVRRLYFLSRDAYLLCRAARVLAPRFGNIDCRHLKISRKSTLFPSTDEISPSKMPWLRRPAQPIRLSDLLQKLSLDWADVGQHFSSLTKGGGNSWSLTTDREWDEFWTIVQSPPVVDLVRDQIRDKRANILAYLRAEGLCDNVPAGVVDVGWHMSVQTSLRKLLEQNAGVQAPRGYFLGLAATRLAPSDSGEVTALFYEQATYHHWGAPQYEVVTRVDVLDNVFGLAPHGTAIGYKMEGSNVEAMCAPETEFHAELVDQLGTAVELFCKNNSEYVTLYSDDDTARELIDALVSTWCFHPNKSALKALDHIMVTDGTSAIPSQPLLQPWRLLDTAKTLIPGRLRETLRIRVYSPVWPEAAFHRSGKLVQFVFLASAALRLLRKRSNLELLSLLFRARR